MCEHKCNVYAYDGTKNVLQCLPRRPEDRFTNRSTALALDEPLYPGDHLYSGFSYLEASEQLRVLSLLSFTLLCVKAEQPFYYWPRPSATVGRPFLPPPRRLLLLPTRTTSGYCSSGSPYIILGGREGCGGIRKLLDGAVLASI